MTNEIYDRFEKIKEMDISDSLDQLEKNNNIYILINNMTNLEKLLKQRIKNLLDLVENQKVTIELQKEMIELLKYNS